MAGSSVEQLQALNAQAVLKFHVGGMLFADDDAECPDPDGLVAADGTITLPDPSAWKSAGRVTTDGITTSRSMSSEDTNSWQSLAIVRSDVTEDSISLKAKFQEYNLVNFAIRNGLSLADAASVFTSSGLAHKRDTSGKQPQRRCIVVARDTKYGITLAQILPNVTYSDQGDETIGRSTELQLDGTYKALVDDVYGTDFATAANGPGWAALFADSVAPGTWAADTAYTLNQRVAADGHIYKVTTAGTSGSEAPTWPESGSVTDGTVVWSFVS